MKVLKLSAAVAAATLAASAVNAQNVNAVAIIGSAALTDGLKCVQEITDCDGNNDVACAPSLSSAEVRSLLTAATYNSGSIGNADTGEDLGTCSGLSGKSGGITRTRATSTDDAVSSFLSSGTAGGLSCGQGLLPFASAGTDAAVQSGVNAAGLRVGLVHATELDGSVGFIKLDGVAPSALALASSNYNMLTDQAAAVGDTPVSALGITTGTVAVVDGIATHRPVACSPLNTGFSIPDASGGSI